MDVQFRPRILEDTERLKEDGKITLAKSPGLALQNMFGNSNT